MASGKNHFCERLFETLTNHVLLNALDSLSCDIYIPSQVKEAKSGLDALFHSGKRKLLMLQYKIAEEYTKPPLKLKKPAFHFDLHKSSKGYVQHNLLVHKAKRYGCAGYAVPGFVTYGDLYDSYHSGKLLENSYLIVPKHIIGDKKHHSIKFNKYHAYQCSERANEIEIWPLAKLISKPEQLDCPAFSKEEFIESFREEEMIDNTNNNLEKQVDLFLAQNKIILLAL